jgi:hypothetical protein
MTGWLLGRAARGRAIGSWVALVWVLSLAGASGPSLASDGHRTVTRAFASGRSTLVFSMERRFLGRAINVCLSPTVPAGCPLGATAFGIDGGSGWAADLSSIPGSTWIWAPGITPQTAPAEFAQFFFVTPVVIRGRPVGGVLSFAVDDFAEVSVNGTVVATAGSITDVSEAGAAQSQTTVVDVGAFLRPGRNIIAVRAQNGPPEFAGTCGATCTYAQNPAGVVFGGSITYRPRDVCDEDEGERARDTDGACDGCVVGDDEPGRRTNGVRRDCGEALARR